MVLSLRSSQLSKMAAAFRVGFDNFYPGTYQRRVSTKSTPTFLLKISEQRKRGRHGAGGRLGSRQTRDYGDVASWQGAAKTVPRVGTFGLGSGSEAAAVPAAGLAGPDGLTARSRAGTELRSGPGTTMRASRPQPGGRVSGLVPMPATWGSGPATARRVSAFSFAGPLHQPSLRGAQDFPARDHSRGAGAEARQGTRGGRRAE